MVLVVSVGVVEDGGGVRPGGVEGLLDFLVDAGLGFLLD
jgi:hypothetical protein